MFNEVRKIFTNILIFSSLLFSLPASAQEGTTLLEGNDVIQLIAATHPVRFQGQGETGVYQGLNYILFKESGTALFHREGTVYFLKAPYDIETATAYGQVLSYLYAVKDFKLFGQLHDSLPPQGPKGDQGIQGLVGAAGSSFSYSMTCGTGGTDACKVGSVGPGRGWIFFVDYHDDYAGFDYLEAAPADIATVVWCNNDSTSLYTAPKGVGQGRANTDVMLLGCTAGAAVNANTYATATTTAGEWFLGSVGEMKLMYDNLLTAGVSGFAHVSYWSSSEYGSGNAWKQNFNNGNQDNDLKNFSYLVRAVRAF